MSESKAMILGLSGLELDAEERAFFRAESPWGFILFARNILSADQLRRLTDSLREISRPDVPIFIDQEGGRVQRIKPPLTCDYPSGSALGEIYRGNRLSGIRAAWLMSRLHAFDLKSFGINADCLPVLDVPVAGAHDVIGNRAYGTEPAIVADMGRAAAEGLLAGGVLPVIKHIPGHGRAFADSHMELPVVDTPLDELRKHDFPPFIALNDIAMAMTAHVVYSALDPENPATTSSKIIRDVIREEMGYDGLLMSDDVSMKALAGSFEERTQAIFEAGCDLVLHCNGNMQEMCSVAEHTPVLSGKSFSRANRTLLQLNNTDDSDEQSLREEFSALFEHVA